MDTPVSMLDCSVCMTEIPESETVNAEASDYVAYFCGLECYSQWREHGLSELGPDSQLLDSGWAEAA